MKQLFGSFLLISTVLLFSFNSTAAISHQQQKIGVGAIIGDPTALSAKYWLNQKYAVDGGLGFDFSDFFLLYGDYLAHFPGLFKTDSPFINSLNPYVGIGPLLVFASNNHKDNGHYFDHHDDSIALGARIPFGVEWMAREIPVGISLELAPGLTIVPGTNGFVQAGVAIRYYF